MPPKPQQGEEPVKLESLSFQELMQIKERFNQELQRLGEGAGQLQSVMNTIASTQKAITQLKASQQGPVRVNFNHTCQTRGSRACRS